MAFSLLIIASASNDIWAAEKFSPAEGIPAEATLFSLPLKPEVVPPLSGSDAPAELVDPLTSPQDAEALINKNPTIEALTLPVAVTTKNTPPGNIVGNSQEKASPTTATATGKLFARINGILNSAIPLPFGASSQNPQKPETSNSLFDGTTRSRGALGFAPSSRNSPSTTPIINDEGIQVSGKAAQYYKEVSRFVEEYKDKINLSESLGVMDDTYAEVWAKLKVIEAVVLNHKVNNHNTHLEETLTWVDGVAKIGNKRVAIYTQRVFFHHAPNPQSEIKEGILRVGAYLKKAQEEFKKGGRMEQTLGRVDQVILGFDTRGYDEIKQFMKARENELKKTYGNRFRFVYLDEIASVPKTVPEMRVALNSLISRYQGDPLQQITDGVVYSRYTGLLLELRTLEYYYKRGYKILQSGREIFDADGHYITELDAVVKSPEGVVYLVEAKSARVLLPQKHVLEGKILYKLDAYKKNQTILENELGAPLNVIFAMDLGLAKAQGRTHGNNVEREARQRALLAFLKNQEPILSRRYGFPVSFLFIDGGAERK